MNRPKWKSQVARLNQRELATVLAALRYWQESVDDDARPCFPHFEGLSPLSDREIDRLCERLNTDKVTGQGAGRRCGEVGDKIWNKAVA